MSIANLRATLRTTAEDAFDAGLRRSLLIHRFKQDTINDTVRFLNRDLFPDMTKLWQSRLAKITARGTDIGPEVTKRLRDMLAETDGLIAGAMRKVNGKLETRLLDAAVSEAEWQTRVMKASHAPFELGIHAPSPQVLRALVTEQPMQGRILKDWFDGLTANVQRSASQQLRLGIAQGESYAQIARRLQGKGQLFDKTRAQASAIASTATQHTMNSAREMTYKENSDVVKGVQYVATLDARTTEICSELDGKVFDIGDGPRPPQHFNCRSTTVPVTKSWKELGLEDNNFKETPEGTRAFTAATPSDRKRWAAMTVLQRMQAKAKLSGQVPAKTTRQTWLRQQPLHVVEAALGKKRAQMFLKGELDFRGMIDASRRPLTLAELDAMSVAHDRAAKLATLSPAQKTSEMLWRVEALIEAKNAQVAAKPGSAAHVAATKKYNSLRSQLHNIDKNWKTFAAQHGYDAKTGGKFTATPGYVSPGAKGKGQTAPLPADPAPSKSTPKPPAQIPAPVAPVAPPGTPGTLVAFDITEDAFTKIGTKPGGSNPGYLARDANGDRWLVKFPANADIARNEVLAARLYKHADANVPEVKLVRGKDGKSLGVASRIEPDVKPNPAYLKAGADPEVAKFFATDAFLANWDVVGLSYDNMLLSGTKVIRIDTGGALRYRAQGALKGKAFGNVVTEIDSLRDLKVNPQAASVFGKMSDAQILASMNHAIDAFDSKSLDALVSKYGPVNAADRSSLLATLNARRADLIAKRDALAAKLAQAPAVTSDLPMPVQRYKTFTDSGNLIPVTQLDANQKRQRIANLYAELLSETDKKKKNSIRSRLWAVDKKWTDIVEEAEFFNTFFHGIKPVPGKIQPFKPGALSSTPKPAPMPAPAPVPTQALEPVSPHVTEAKKGFSKYLEFNKTGSSYIDPSDLVPITNFNPDAKAFLAAKLEEMYKAGLIEKPTPYTYKIQHTAAKNAQLKAALGIVDDGPSSTPTPASVIAAEANVKTQVDNAINSMFFSDTQVVFVPKAKITALGEAANAYMDKLVLQGLVNKGADGWWVTNASNKIINSKPLPSSATATATATAPITKPLGTATPSVVFPDRWTPTYARHHNDSLRVQHKSDAAFKRKWGEWKSALPKDQLSEIESWKRSSTWVWKYQVHGTGGPDQARRMELLTRAFESAPATRPGHLVRGVSVSLREVDALLQPGYEFDLTAHAPFTRHQTSSFGGSTHLARARKHAQIDGDATQVSVKIEIKNGSGADIARIGSHRAEGEVVMLSGTRLRVIAVEDRPGYGLVIKTEQLNNFGVSPGTSPVTAVAQAPKVISTIREAKAAAATASSLEELGEIVKSAGTLHPALRNTKVTLAGMNTKMAREAIEGVLDMLATTPGSESIVINKIGISSTVRGGTVAVTKVGKNRSVELLFNRELFQSSAKVQALLQQQFDRGWLAGNTVRHLVNHELAHVMRAGMKNATERAILFAKNFPSPISGYAATDAHEAFAEAWSIISTPPANGWSKASLPFQGNAAKQNWMRNFALELKSGIEAQSGINSLQDALNPLHTFINAFD